MSVAGQRPVYVRAAVVDRSWRDAERSLQDMIFETVRLALHDGGVAFTDVDTVVTAAHDLVDGRSLSSMVSSPAAGSYLRHEVRFSDDGATAFAAAAMRVSSGESQNCIVAAWGRASEGQPEKISNALFDPMFTKPLAMTELAVSAMRASGALRRFPGYEEHRDAAAAARGRSERIAPEQCPPVPLPLRPAELPRWADLVVATVLSSEPTDIRLAGFGSSSDPYWLGDREMLALPALREAASKALSAGGHGPSQLNVIELDGLTLFDEALAAEAIKIAPCGDGMEKLVTDPRINRSGGYAAGYCAPTAGLVRIAEVVAAIRRSDRPGGSPLIGMATGSSTVAGQTQTAIVLESL